MLNWRKIMFLKLEGNIRYLRNLSFHEKNLDAEKLGI